MTPSRLTAKQTRSFPSRPAPGRGSDVAADVRFDDQCGNGHNTFAATGTVFFPDGGRGYGCCHEEIAAAFPELAKYLKWHLCSTDGPTHYLANTLYAAGDRDCWGRRKGEPWTVEHYVAAVCTGCLLVEWPEEEHRILGPKVRKFTTRAEAQEVADVQGEHCEVVEWATQFGEGKERELAAARRHAVWPEATDEELLAPDLKEKLEARLPALLEAFKADMEELGFTW